MYIVIFCSVLTLFLTYIEAKCRVKGGMKWGFVIVTILGMIHYDYGNDYMSYYELYNQVTSYNFDWAGIIAKDYYREPGWVILCWLFKPLGGFFVMVAVLNLIQNYIVYKFIQRNVNKIWWPIAVFVYLFATSFYLMSFSMMRQSFVLIVFLGMWRFIEERKWWIPLVVFWLLSFVHSSAIVLIPFAFLGYMPMKNGKLIGVLYVLILLLLWLSKNTINDIFSYALAMDDSFAQYADTYEQDNPTIQLGVGFVLNMIPFILSVIFLIDNEHGHSASQKMIVALAAISYIVAPFSQIIPASGRLGMYFSIYKLGAIPLVYSNVRNRNVRYLLLGLCLFMILYDYIIFFKNPVWVDKYTNFHTIFGVL